MVKISYLASISFLCTLGMLHDRFYVKYLNKKAKIWLHPACIIYCDWKIVCPHQILSFGFLCLVNEKKLAFALYCWLLLCSCSICCGWKRLGCSLDPFLWYRASHPRIKVVPSKQKGGNVARPTHGQHATSNRHHLSSTLLCCLSIK